VNTFIVRVPLSPLLVLVDAPEALAATAVTLPTRRQALTTAVILLPNRDVRAGRLLCPHAPFPPPELGIVI
jgi:hypothetical protein